MHTNEPVYKSVEDLPLNHPDPDIRWITTALYEVVMLKTNLEYHDRKADELITQLDKEIELAKEHDMPYDGQEALKNEVYFIKYQIAELT